MPQSKLDRAIAELRAKAAHLTDEQVGAIVREAAAEAAADGPSAMRASLLSHAYRVTAMGASSFRLSLTPTRGRGDRTGPGRT